MASLHLKVLKETNLSNQLQSSLSHPIMSWKVLNVKAYCLSLQLFYSSFQLIHSTEEFWKVPSHVISHEPCSIASNGPLYSPPLSDLKHFSFLPVSHFTEA